MTFKKKKLTTPQQNAGWGLIFRLNDLWKEVESHAPKGEYDMWNFKLDRIWCNLLYRGEVEVERDKKTKLITGMKLTQDDAEEKEFLDSQISKWKKTAKKLIDAEGLVVNKKEFNQANRNHYKSLMIKDIWLRKFMNKLDLYLQEIEFDPSKAIYGGR